MAESKSKMAHITWQKAKARWHTLHGRKQKQDGTHYMAESKSKMAHITWQKAKQDGTHYMAESKSKMAHITWQKAKQENVMLYGKEQNRKHAC